MSKTVKITGAAHFSDLLKKSRIVVADFYADWCGPCTQIAPIYEQLSLSLSQPDAVTFVKIDTEKQKDITLTYSVTAMPTFIIFRDQNVVDRVTGADPVKLQAIVKKLVSEIESTASGSGDGASWRGADLPRGYQDITDQIEKPRCDLMNFDTLAGAVEVLLDPSKPSALDGKKDAKDWVESDTDEQLLLFLPFQSILKLHTIQLTSLPPADDDDDDDDAPMRPRTIHFYTNKPHNLGFDEAEDTAAVQTIELEEKDWNKDGTANIALRFVKYQNISSLVIFIAEGDGSGDKTRLDRIRLIGESGEKRDMGKLEKIGDEPGE